jgi:hypothetical protein
MQLVLAIRYVQRVHMHKQVALPSASELSSRSGGLIITALPRSDPLRWTAAALWMASTFPQHKTVRSPYTAQAESAQSGPTDPAMKLSMLIPAVKTPSTLEHRVPALRLSILSDDRAGIPLLLGTAFQFITVTSFHRCRHRHGHLLPRFRFPCPRFHGLMHRSMVCVTLIAAALNVGSVPVAGVLLPSASQRVQR